MTDAAKAFQYETEFLSAVEANFEAAKGKQFRGSIWESSRADESDRLRALLASNRIFDRDKLKSLPANRRIALHGFERRFLFGKRRTGVAIASVLSPLGHYASSADEAGPPIGLGELVDHVRRLAGDARVPHIIGVCSPSGFTEEARSARVDMPGATVVLIEPDGHGGWRTTAGGQAVEPRVLKIFDPERTKEKVDRVRSAIEEKSADLLTGGLSVSSIAARTSLPEDVVRRGFEQVAADDPELRVADKGGEFLLFRGAPVRQERKPMNVIERIKQLLSGEGDETEKINLLAERRAALAQRRDRMYDDIGKLLYDETRGGEVIIEGFSDDYFVVEVDVSSYFYARIWVRYQDPGNGYMLQLKGNINMSVSRVKDGAYTHLGTIEGFAAPVNPIRVRVWNDNGTDTISVYSNGTLQGSVTDSEIPYGGVAFGGTSTPEFDNVKIGYDNNNDGDIADAGDDIIWDEDFGSTSTTVSHDHAGNLIDDDDFVYIYDAWNRLVKVRASNDADVTIQTAEFDARGRRIKKVVTYSGDLDATVVCLYDGVAVGASAGRIIETRDGSGNLYQQFIHGTQYIDELVMVWVKDKGDLYVHQDANWNVIGLTDLEGSIVERHVYRPYGEVTVNQETGYGDRDGDGDVVATDKGTPGTDCTDTVTGACRILDLDFDGDYDSTDATLFDALPQGLARHPGRIATNVDQPFAHQGLLYDPEIGSYQNRARQYDLTQRRFMQKDARALGVNRFHPWGQYRDGMNLLQYVGNNPARFNDPFGEDIDWSKPPEEYPITEDEAKSKSDYCLNGPGHEGNCYREIPPTEGGPSKHLCFKTLGASVRDIDFDESHVDSIGPATGKRGDGKCKYSICLLIAHFFAHVIGGGVSGIPPPLL